MPSLSFDPKVWGPHFWFVLHSLTLTYPEYPNDVTKRKYYDLVHNLPLFLPSGGSEMAEMIDKYPVTPYLDGRESFVRWMVFLHNKYNIMLGHPPMDLMEALDKFYDQFQSPLVHDTTEESNWRHFIVAAFILGLVLVIMWVR